MTDFGIFGAWGGTPWAKNANFGQLTKFGVFGIWGVPIIRGKRPRCVVMIAPFRFVAFSFRGVFVSSVSFRIRCVGVDRFVPFRVVVGSVSCRFVSSPFRALDRFVSFRFGGVVRFRQFRFIEFRFDSFIYIDRFVPFRGAVGPVSGRFVRCV